MSKDNYQFVANYPVKKYRCGLKAGDKVRLKKQIVVRDHTGKPTGKIYPAGQIWTVLQGARKKPKVVWFRQTNGGSHTWDDDQSVFETFELVSRARSKKGRQKRKKIPKNKRGKTVS